MSLKEDEVYFSGKDHTFPLHIHERIIAGFVSSGKVILSFEEESYELSSGDAYIIFPFTPHSAKTFDEAAIVVITFAQNSDILCRTRKKYLILKDIAGKYPSIYNKNIPDAALIEQILIEQVEPSYSFKDTDSERIRNIISENYSEKNTLEDVSVCGKSRFSVLRSFRRDFGVTPSVYHILVRIRKAKVMMLEGRSLIETALDCGFCDQSHFNRTFKKYTGLTPEEFRNKTMRSN
ncbi:MAG: helix-turn-helix domain-containing protein [Spirochaetes bacterium]|nr:helix-turn-helix domain-containing protein [Spirochaetota bacterium]